MEDNTYLTKRAYKQGFREALASQGLSVEDLPWVIEKYASVHYPGLLKNSFDLTFGFGKPIAALANVAARGVSGLAAAAVPAARFLTTWLPYSVAGMGALGGGTLALVTAKEQARQQAILDEEVRLNRLIQAAEAANLARGIEVPTSLPPAEEPEA